MITFEIMMVVGLVALAVVLGIILRAFLKKGDSYEGNVWEDLQDKIDDDKS